MKLFSTFREAFFLATHPALWLRKPLDVSELAKDPFEQFERWFKEAKRRPFGEFPNWLCLSTLGTDGYPEGRIVLLKSFDREGFIFYTNTTSRKGRSLEATPRASMTFYWEALQHQVRIQGDIEKVSDEQADEYFASRPRASQLGAWASLQSEELASRNALEERMKEFRRNYNGESIPRPPHWTGFRLKPRRFEFWELRLSRLHDRFEYSPSAGGWKIQRLYP